jgi:hypothetical protein
MADIFEWIDCEDCPYYRFHQGRTWGDPDDCYPDEVECLDGDYPCDRMIARIEEGLQDGDFAFSLSYLADFRCLTAPETKEDY